MQLQQKTLRKSRVKGTFYKGDQAVILPEYAAIFNTQQKTTFFLQNKYKRK